MANLCNLTANNLSIIEESAKEFVKKDDKDLYAKTFRFLEDITGLYSIISENRAKKACDRLMKVFSDEFGKELPAWANASNFRSIMLGFDSERVLNDNGILAPLEEEDFAEITSRKWSLRAFLKDAFGFNNELSSYAQTIAMRNIFDACFVNRGSIKESDVTCVQTVDDLNDNLRSYLEQLFKRVLNYLRGKVNLPEDLKLFDGEDYTGVLENPEVRSAIELHIYNENNKENVSKLFNKLLKGNISESEKLLLDAFNDWVFLDNIDNYLSIILDGVIKFKAGTRGKKVSGTKYMLSDSTAKVYYDDLDEAVLERSTDALTRLAITTTEVVTWDGNTTTDKRLSFNDWSYIIGSLKRLIYNKGADIEFTLNGYDLYEFSSDTLEVLRQENIKNFSELLGKLPLNAERFLPAIMDIITNKDFYARNKQQLYSVFNKDLLDKLMSINVGIFNGDNSLRANSTNYGNYYSYVALSAASIFRSTMLEYHLDSEGIYKVRPLDDVLQRRLRDNIVTNVNELNSHYQIDDWNEYASGLEMTINGNIRATEDTKDMDIKSFSFKIDGIKVDVIPSTLKVIYNSELSINEEAKKFVDLVLGLNLRENKALDEILSSGEDINDLIRMASRTIFLKYLQNVTTKDEVNPLAKVREINSTLGMRNGDLNLVSNSDSTTLDKIALAQAIVRGYTTSSLVLDGDGKANTKSVFYKLFAGYKNQYEILNKRDTSITKDLAIVNIPDLAGEVIRFKSQDNDYTTTKSPMRMSVSELFMANFIYDFIGGLYGTDNKSPVGGNKVLIVTSVNADKTDTSKILVDLNVAPVNNNHPLAVENPNLIDKKLVNYTKNELITFVNHELGGYYKRMIDVVLNDFNKLSLYYSDTIPDLRFNINDNFSEFNQWVKLNHPETTPTEYLSDLVRIYNENHLNDIVELVDVTHYRTLSNGDIASNQVMLNLLARYSTEGSVDFWNIKEREMARTLLDEDIIINTSNSKLIELAQLRSKLKNSKPSLNWIDPSGNMIVFKFRRGNEEVSVSSLNDAIRELGENWFNEIDNIENFTLNPFLAKYNLIDHLITQEFLDTTVGSFTNHPYKGELRIDEVTNKSNLFELEASLLEAQNKRNVSLTTPIIPFLLNHINGIPEDYNIAVIEEYLDNIGNVNGLITEFNAIDGATIADPMTTILENNSLGGSKAGIIKKPFVHSYNERTGTGIIIKTETVGITNEDIRNSKEKGILARKMMEHVWRRDDGSLFTADITKNSILPMYDIPYEDIYYSKAVLGENGWENNYYRVVRTKSLGNNIYEVTYRQVDIDGSDLINGETNLYTESTYRTEINNNYSLWLYFGAERSMKLSGGKLVPSNTSVENCVIVANHVGYGKENARSLADFYQPLKHSNIHYICTKGAVKQGAANVNSSNKWFDNSALNFLKIKMTNAGIVLDKEHIIDVDEVASISTQAMTSSVLRGRTFDSAYGLYTALGMLSNLNAGDHVEAARKVFQNPDDPNFLDEFREILNKSLVLALTKDSNNYTNFAQTLTENLIDRVRNNGDTNIKFANLNVPLSDSTIYNKVLTSINAYLTTVGIRAKLPGAIAILSPSHKMYKLYAGKKLGEYINPEVELNEIQNQYNDNPIYDNLRENNLISDLNLGRTYKIGYIQEDGNIDTKTELILTPKLYKLLKDDINSGRVSRIVECIVDRSSIYKRATDGSINTEIPDLKYYESYAVLELTDDGNTVESIIPINSIEEGQELLSKILSGRILSVERFNFVGRDLAAYNTRFKTTTGEDFLLYDLDSINALYKLSDIKQISDVNSRCNELNVFLKNNTNIGDAVKYRHMGLIKFKAAHERILNGESTLSKEDFNRWFKDFNTINRNGKHINRYEIPENTNPFDYFLNLYANEVYETAYKATHKWKQFDLNNLSKSTSNARDWYDQLIAERDRITDEAALNEWYERYGYIINIKFGLADGKLFNILDTENNRTDRVNVSKGTFDRVDEQVKKWVDGITTIKINGDNRSIDKNSILESAYEAIVPLTFGDKFGLSVGTNLSDIVNDLNYFIKLILNKLGTKVSSSNYSVELKSSSGDHLYILSRDFLNTSNLIRILNPLITEESGSRYRIDSDGNILYELDENAELYKDEVGNEIIVTDNVGFYFDNLDYYSVGLSGNLLNNESILRNILIRMHHSNNEVARNIADLSTSGTHTLEDILRLNYLLNNRENLEDIINNKNNPIYKKGMSMYNSFIEALNIIEARTPGQSMQSFMAMKIAGFDNTGTNVTYVSTMQNLLLGSDYDIDTVTMFTYDIDRNGTLALWSPYVNLTSSENLRASKKLSLPTGKELEDFEISSRSSDYMYVLRNYANYKNKDGSEHVGCLRVRHDADDMIDIRVDTSTPERILMFNELLLNTNKIIRPRYRDNNKFVLNFNDLFQYTTLNEANSIRILNEYLGPDTEELSVKERIPGYEERATTRRNEYLLNVINNIYGLIKNIVDRHNLYLINSSKAKRSKIINNYLISNLIDIIGDPINLELAQSPTDDITKPLKNIADNTSIANQMKGISVGNVIGKFRYYTQAVVGKEDVGIAAVGMKTFGGLTEYNDYVLNYGTLEEQERLLFKEYRLNKGGNIIPILANVYALDPNSIRSFKVLEAMAKTDNLSDAALQEAAVASLAADNAKDLKLGKLNAGTATIGMYIYGIMVGVPFDLLANILTSKTGIHFAKLLLDNVFSGDFGYKRADQVSKYFLNYLDGRFLSKYDVTTDPTGKTKFTSPLIRFKNSFERATKNFNFASKLFNRNINTFARSSISLDEKLVILSLIRNGLNISNSYEREIFNLLCNFIDDYIIKIHNADINDVYDLAMLASGSWEVRNLGQIYRSNLRIETQTDKFLNQINTIKKAFINMGDDRKVDVLSYIFDPQYRELIVKEYNKIKHTFNILEAPFKSPNFTAYMETLGTTLMERMQSFKFRSLMKLIDYVGELFEDTNPEKYTKSITRFIDDYVRNEWMKNTRLIIRLPEGSKVFTNTGDLITTEGNTDILLGTDPGNASFRVFMEKVVIPELKDLYRGNRFIKDLLMVSITRTVTKNPTSLYSLGINMMPRDVTENAILDSYRTDFDAIANTHYIIRDSNGNELLRIPIGDLFTYYTMIAHGWQTNERSLISILLHYQTISDLLTNFRDFQAELDKSGMDLTLKNEDEYNLLMRYVALRGSPFTSTLQYIYHRNYETGKIQLMQRKSESPENSDDINDMIDSGALPEEYEMYENSTGNYEYTQALNTRVFPTGQITDTKRTITGIVNRGKDMEYIVRVDYDISNVKDLKDLSKIKLNSIEIGLGTALWTDKNTKSLERLVKHKEIPFNKLNGEAVIDIDQIVDEIYNCE